MGKPYATIAHAYSTITDASATKVYQVVLFQGTYAENVALKPFIELVGWDPTQWFGGEYPARMNGNVTLDTGFSAAGAQAWITAVDIGGTVTLDFVAATSTDGVVSITNSQLEDTATVTMAGGNSFELHGCTLVGDYVQAGGNAVWENCVGSGIPLLHVQARTGSGASLNMHDSTWDGDIHADQNGNTTGGQVVTVNMNNASARSGTCTLTSAGTNVPVINAAYGDLPENPVLTGSSSVALSRQMRVSVGLTVPSSSLGAGAVTDVLIPLAGSVLGATSIEFMACTLTPVGTLWTTLAGNDVTWSFYVKDNAGTQEVHAVFWNPGDAPVTSGALPLLFNAYQPNVIA